MRTILVATLLSLFSSPAFAILEIRGNYGTMSGDLGSFNSGMEDWYDGMPDTEGPSVFGIDVLIDPPLIPLVGGLRYEGGSHEASGTGKTSGGADLDLKGETEMTRLSLLAGWRIITLPIFYIGILGQYTLSQELNYTTKATIGGNTAQNSWKGKMDAGYGIGVEAGATLTGFLVGAEVGYTAMKAKSFTNADGAPLADDDDKDIAMDLSGTYMKIHLGVYF